MNGCSKGARRLRPRHQAGVGLIEVLVAVLVLSIGFLGIAALQARSLSMNNSAMARNVATMASYSILDAMRADLANAQNGAYIGSVAGNTCSTMTSTGSLANEQLYQWCGQLAAGLGASASTTGTIDCIGSLGDCTITVSFDDSKSETAGTSTTTGMQTITTRAML